jgi:hypothetical protein
VRKAKAAVEETLRVEPSLATAIDALAQNGELIDGFMVVEGYSPAGRPPAEVVVMEKAAEYGATAVFFEAGSSRHPGPAQALIYISKGPAKDPEFARLHKRLWNWGGVPVVYRHTPGLVQLFRCRHDADFLDKNGALVCRPVDFIKLAGKIARAEAYWNAELLRNGTIWDDPEVAEKLLSREKAAHRALITAIGLLNAKLKRGELNIAPELVRRLLILSLLIAYLDERGALGEGYFGSFLPDASGFADVLTQGSSLVALLEDLETKFNGGVFSLDDEHKRALKDGLDLSGFQRLIEGKEDKDGQLDFWKRYSFKDLPVELISHIYQMFVKNTKSSVYTPPALVRLLLDEVLDPARLDKIVTDGELLLDPACGSGIFLVEAYKRIILHWRSKNNWGRPSIAVLKDLVHRVRGTDLEHGAVELAAFSLSLAMCDELTSDELRRSKKLFPPLIDRTIITSCFFEHLQKDGFKDRFGVVVGNPPFASDLDTPGAIESCKRYDEAHQSLPDKQIAFLFLHDSMSLLAPGGVLCMLQQYNFLYNPGADDFRREFIAKWDLREILDFVSIRGLFDAADTKAIAVVAEASKPTDDRKVLHAIFRRTPRARADLRFEVDYYDLQWHRRGDLLKESGVVVWRAGLLGGVRVQAVVTRLRTCSTLGDFATKHRWEHGEGFIQGDKGRGSIVDYIAGKQFLPSEGLTGNGVEADQIKVMPRVPIEVPRRAEIFRPPLLLVREQMDLHHSFWDKGDITYKDQIVGFSGKDPRPLKVASKWLNKNKLKLQGFVAANSTKLFTKKATAISCKDIYDLPFPSNGDLDLSENESIVLDDIALYYREFMRHGFASPAGKPPTGIDAFRSLLCSQISAVYRDNQLAPLASQTWPGMRCELFAFGKANVDLGGMSDLKEHVEALLHEKRGTSLAMTRIARIYDRKFVYLIKPDRERYWLKSIALRDADDLLFDLRSQGF